MPTYIHPQQFILFQKLQTLVTAYQTEYFFLFQVQNSFTRPAAEASLASLSASPYLNPSHPYPSVFLYQDIMDALLKKNCVTYFLIPKPHSGDFHACSFYKGSYVKLNIAGNTLCLALLCALSYF